MTAAPPPAATAAPQAIAVPATAVAAAPTAEPTPVATEAPPAATATPEPQPAAGPMAPLFTLPNATGGQTSLAGFQGNKNVVLVFYRAFW